MSFGQALTSSECNKSPYPYDCVSKVPLFINLATPASPVFVGVDTTKFLVSRVSGTTYLVTIPFSVTAVLNIRGELSVTSGTPQYGAIYFTTPTFSNGKFTFYMNITNVTGGSALTLSLKGVYLFLTVTSSANPQF